MNAKRQPNENELGLVIPFPTRTKRAKQDDYEFVREINKPVLAALDAKGKAGKLPMMGLLRWRQYIEREKKALEGKDASPDLLCQEVAVDAAWNLSMAKKMPREWGRGANFDAGRAAMGYAAAQKALVSFDHTKGPLREWLYMNAKCALLNLWRTDVKSWGGERASKKDAIAFADTITDHETQDGETIAADSSPIALATAVYDAEPIELADIESAEDLQPQRVSFGQVQVHVGHDEEKVQALARAKLAPILAQAKLSQDELQLLTDYFCEEMTFRELEKERSESRSTLQRRVVAILAKVRASQDVATTDFNTESAFDFALAKQEKLAVYISD